MKLETRRSSVMLTVTLAAAVFATPVTVRGQTLAYPREVGKLVTRSFAQVTMSGNTAYVSSLLDGVQVVDLTQAGGGALKPVGVLGVPEGASASVLDEVSGLLYVATPKRLLVVDVVSAPQSPKVVGEASGYSGIPNHVSLDGKAVYVTAVNGGTEEVATYALPGARTPLFTGVAQLVDGYGQKLLARHALASKGVVYVAAADAGLFVYRRTSQEDPSELQLAGKVDTGVAVKVAVQGVLAYVADAKTGLAVVNVEDPTAPRIVFRHPDNRMSTRDVTTGEDGIVFTVSSSHVDDLHWQAVQGMHVVPDPTSPWTALPAPGSPPLKNAVAVAASGSYLAVVSGTELGATFYSLPPAPAADAPSPPSPPPSLPGADPGYAYVGEAPLAGLSFSSKLAVTEDGTTVFVGSWKEGLHVVDVAEPTAPTRVGGITRDALLNGATGRRSDRVGVAALQDTVYLIFGDSLLVINASTPAAPFVASRTPLNANGGHAVASTSRALVPNPTAATGALSNMLLAGNEWFDVSDDASVPPQKKGELPLQATTAAATAEEDGSVMYVADNYGRLSTVRITASEWVVDEDHQAYTPGWTGGVAVAGGKANRFGVLAEGSAGLITMRRTTPSDASRSLLQSQLEFGANVPALSVASGLGAPFASNQVFVGLEQGRGVAVVDVSDPVYPTVVATLPLRQRYSAIYSIATSATKAFAIDHIALRVVELNETAVPPPTSPSPPTPAPPTHVPPTPAPDTPVPNTPAPDTPAPLTAAPDTTVPAPPTCPLCGPGQTCTPVTIPGFGDVILCACGDNVQVNAPAPCP